MKNVNKKAQTQFAWIFSMIIGAVIIFIAIYFAVKYIGTSELQTSAELVRELDIVLNPFSSIGAVSTMSLEKEVTMPAEVMINFTCDAEEGYENLALRTTNGRGEWFNYKMTNKYVFSENLEGNEFTVFSKSLYLPWRVDDMIYIVSEDYCFVNPPETIRREISDMNNDRIKLECKEGDKKVCFGMQNCDIYVNYDLGTIRKDRETLYFSGDAMMYAAIFSDNNVYKCNMQRLMDRLAVQTEINIRKAERLDIDGCSTGNVRSSLNALKGAADSNLLPNVDKLAKEVAENNPENCPIF